MAGEKNARYGPLQGLAGDGRGHGPEIPQYLPLARGDRYKIRLILIRHMGKPDMLTRKVSPELIREWKDTSATYRPLLNPNKKTGNDIVAYLTGKYPARELPTGSLNEVVSDNVLLNDCNARKMPAGKTPEVVGFIIENTGAGKHLYENQDEFFRGMSIIAGVELHTAYFIVEGSSLLWDELFAFRGLDDEDLTNYYLVAEYVACLRRFDQLDRVMAGNKP
jgi:hypothetical protein